MVFRAVFLVLLFAVYAGAFAPLSNVQKIPGPELASSSSYTPFAPPTQVGCTSTTTLYAKKKDLKKKVAPPARKKMDWNLGLVFVYMNPVRNPNSIFAYMFLVLYVLGKYSESHN